MTDRIILQIIPVQGYEAVYDEGDGKEWVEPVFVFALVEEADPTNGTAPTRYALPMVMDGYGELKDGPGGEGLELAVETSNYKGIRLIKSKE